MATPKRTEKHQPTTEPQPIANLTEPALKRLQSERPSFKTQEEADAAYRAHKHRTEVPDRLRASGYPERSIRNLAIMRGPGLEGAIETTQYLGRDGVVFLIGDRGPGKTQIATFCAAERIKAGAGCGIYRKALDLWQEIRATWRHESDKNENEVIRRFIRASFLVVDELQERGDTEADRQWCDRMLTHIVDHRYDALLPTLLVANLSPDGYERTIPASVRSRVLESGVVKLCDWPSYRQ